MQFHGWLFSKLCGKSAVQSIAGSILASRNCTCDQLRIYVIYIIARRLYFLKKTKQNNNGLVAPPALLYYCDSTYKEVPP